MQPEIKRLTCQVCGVQIPQGGVFYVGKTEIISGSDGILPDSEETGEKLIESALKDITLGKSEQELMDEVYQEIKIVLCGRCRLLFRDKILDMIKY